MLWHELLNRIIAKVSVRKRVRSVVFGELVRLSQYPSSKQRHRCCCCFLSLFRIDRLFNYSCEKSALLGQASGAVRSYRPSQPSWLVFSVETSSSSSTTFVGGGRRERRRKKEIYVWDHQNNLDEIPVCHLAGRGRRS